MFDIQWFLVLTKNIPPMTCVHLNFNELRVNCLKCHTHTCTTSHAYYLLQIMENQFICFSILIYQDFPGEISQSDLLVTYGIHSYWIWIFGYVQSKEQKCCNTNTRLQIPWNIRFGNIGYFSIEKSEWPLSMYSACIRCIRLCLLSVRFVIVSYLFLKHSLHLKEVNRNHFLLFCSVQERLKCFQLFLSVKSKIAHVHISNERATTTHQQQ